MSMVISEQALRQCVQEWISQGKRVAGPSVIKDDLVLYRWLVKSDQLLLAGYHRAHNSIKEFVFPRHEKLYGYKISGKGIELTQAELPEAPQVVFARPCDAASLPILDHVFNWDFKDVFFNRRRELTTVVTVACQENDTHCFCSAVGGGPGNESGSDVLLLALVKGGFEVRCLTEKGKALLTGKLESSSEVGKIGPAPEKKLDIEQIRAFVNSQFESPMWAAMTQRCLGCGACATTCPTCHCFDIVDEKIGNKGHRARNWDTCQATMFTMHASGHNPRNVQMQRQRQRIYHKFDIYPTKFGVLLCTGCGNCSRVCSVGLGVLPVLTTIQSEPSAK